MKTEEPTPIRERIVNWLALLALLLAGVVWPPLSDAASGSSPYTARAGTLYLCMMPCGRHAEALRQSTRIRAQVTGSLARVHVTQQFENPSDDWVEGLYVFPLSSTAAVDELQMLVGERRIRGEIQRKAEARATYERARNEGRRASLVDQERPNLFSTSVANIAPRSSITVEIAYLDTVPFRDGRYELSLPLSITPRYTPGDPNDGVGGKPPAVATPELVSAAVQEASIDIELLPGFPIRTVKSLSHDVRLQMTGLGRRIRLESSTVPTDRDFELVWSPTEAPDTHSAAFAEQTGDDTYVLVTLMPPQLPVERAYEREVVFIIDTSGSMAGSSIAQARAALQLGIARLQPGDTFNIVRFSDDASGLFPTSQPAVGINRQTASEFIDRLKAAGGTGIRNALELVFAMPATPGALRQLVFVTDGSVSNEADLARLIAAKIGDARLFTVGIGAAPNAYFMREAAAAGRGSYTFVPKIELVRERMEDLFRKIESPALVDLHLHWPEGLSAILAAAMPGDVYVGDPLTIVAKLPKAPSGMLTLTGTGSGGPWTRQLPIRVVDTQAGVAKLWARERIGELSRQKNLSADPARTAEEIANIALAHHLVSDYTSLVAVDVTPVRPVGVESRAEQVPASAPSGGPWAQATGFAPTATSAPLLLVIGVLALALAATLRWLPRRARP